MPYSPPNRKRRVRVHHRASQAFRGKQKRGPIDKQTREWVEYFRGSGYNFDPSDVIPVRELKAFVELTGNEGGWDRDEEWSDERRRSELAAAKQARKIVVEEFRKNQRGLQAIEKAVWDAFRDAASKSKLRKTRAELWDMVVENLSEKF